MRTVNFVGPGDRRGAHFSGGWPTDFKDQHYTNGREGQDDRETRVICDIGKYAGQSVRAPQNLRFQASCARVSIMIVQCARYETPGMARTLMLLLEVEDQRTLGHRNW